MAFAQWAAMRSHIQSVLGPRKSLVVASSALLLCCAPVGAAQARRVKAEPLPDAVEIQLEQTDDASKAKVVRSFVLPLEGSVIGPTELMGEQVSCMLRSRVVSDDKLKVEVSCSRGLFSLSGTSNLTSGESFVLAEVQVDDSKHLRVIVTRR